VTGALEGRELDALLQQARPPSPSHPEGITESLTREELDHLLAHAAEIEEKEASAREPSMNYEEAIATLPLARAGPSVPPVPLHIIAPPVAVPRPASMPRIASAPAIDVRPSRPAFDPKDHIGVDTTVDSVWPKPPRPIGKVAMVVAALGGLASLVTFFVMTQRAPPAASSAKPALSLVPEPPPAAPSTPVSAAQPSVDEPAKQALTRFRDGLRDCVRRAAMVLPGSSRAVPPAISDTSGEGYTSTAADWKTPVFSCSKFDMQEPMRFQMQWQLTKGSSEGLGVVWIDADGDGKADTAYAFRARLKAKGLVETDEVESWDAAHPVVAVSY
jgi:hypothetical protein